MPMTSINPISERTEYRLVFQYPEHPLLKFNRKSVCFPCTLGTRFVWFSALSQAIDWYAKNKGPRLVGSFIVLILSCGGRESTSLLLEEGHYLMLRGRKASDIEATEVTRRDRFRK